MDPEKVENDVKLQAALSYLVSIILVNDKAKSNLKKIKEVQPSPKNREDQDTLEESKASLSELINPRNQPRHRSTKFTEMKPLRVFVQLEDTSGIADENEPVKNNSRQQTLQ